MSLWKYGFLLTLTHFMLAVKGSVFLYSVDDVFVELDTYGHITIGRTNVTDWKFQAAKDNSEVFIHIKELRLLDRHSMVVKRLAFSKSQMRHFEVSDYEVNQYT